jgi:hypothetical protein
MFSHPSERRRMLSSLGPEYSDRPTHQVQAPDQAQIQDLNFKTCALPIFPPCSFVIETPAAIPIGPPACGK